MYHRDAVTFLAIMLALAGIGPTAATGLEVSKLQGEMFIAGATVVDPPSEEPKNTHAYITITGAAARRIYNHMRATPEADACQTGNLIKRAGRLACSIGKSGKDASCDFALDLTSGSLDDGRPC